MKLLQLLALPSAGKCLGGVRLGLLDAAAREPNLATDGAWPDFGDVHPFACNRLVCLT